MAQNIPTVTSDRLNAALATCPEWHSPPASIPGVLRALDGHSNQSFLVTADSRRWVVKLLNQTDHGIDQHSQVVAESAAFAAGLSPRIVFRSASVVISEFIDGRHPDGSHIGAIADLFSAIHSIKAPLKPLDLEAHLANYYAQVRSKTRIASLYKRFNALPKPAPIAGVFCHNDLTAENMLTTGSRIYALDWEYARLSDPAFDLAVFSYSAQLDESDLSALVLAYQHSIPDLFERIRYFERCYGLIEILWWTLRSSPPRDKIAHLDLLLS